MLRLPGDYDAQTSIYWGFLAPWPGTPGQHRLWHAHAAVARSGGELGRLARVLQDMAREVHAREQRLQQQVQALRIEIDQVRKVHQVAEVTESGYFRRLQQEAQALLDALA